jgi:phenol 2-monooxygenase
MFLSSEEGPACKYTVSTEDPDSFIEPLLVLHGIRLEMEQEQIPQHFCPIKGKWRMKGMNEGY